MNPANNVTKPITRLMPRTVLLSDLNGNLNPTPTKRCEPWYKEDATINDGKLIDKSINERHGNPISSRSSQGTQREITLRNFIDQKLFFTI